MNSRALETLIGDALQEDVRTADRITDVLTRTVPWQFPGRVLRAAAELGPQPVDQTRLDHATVAVEFACLHQYLHAISRTQRPLVAPASSSVYADNPVAAILDGDSLQSCAFSRLGRTGADPTTVERCYEQLAAASVSCYEQDAETPQGTGELSLAPLAGVAAGIGARLGGFSRERANALEEATRALGETLPVRTPSKRQSRGTKSTSDATDHVVEVFGNTKAVRERIETLVDTERERVHHP